MHDPPVKYHLRLGCSVLAPERDRLRFLRDPFEMQREAKHCVLHELARALVIMSKHLGAHGEVWVALNNSRVTGESLCENCGAEWKMRVRAMPERQRTTRTSAAPESPCLLL